MLRQRLHSPRPPASPEACRNWPSRGQRRACLREHVLGDEVLQLIDIPLGGRHAPSICERLADSGRRPSLLRRTGWSRWRSHAAMPGRRLAVVVELQFGVLEAAMACVGSVVVLGFIVGAREAAAHQPKPHAGPRQAWIQPTQSVDPRPVKGLWLKNRTILGRRPAGDPPSRSAKRRSTVSERIWPIYVPSSLKPLRRKCRLVRPYPYSPRCGPLPEEARLDVAYRGPSSTGLVFIIPETSVRFKQIPPYKPIISPVAVLIKQIPRISPGNLILPDAGKTGHPPMAPLDGTTPPVALVAVSFGWQRQDRRSWRWSFAQEARHRQAASDAATRLLFQGICCQDSALAPRGLCLVLPDGGRYSQWAAGDWCLKTSGRSLSSGCGYGSTLRRRTDGPNPARSGR